MIFRATSACGAEPRWRACRLRPSTVRHAARGGTGVASRALPLQRRAEVVSAPRAGQPSTRAGPIRPIALAGAAPDHIPPSSMPAGRQRRPMPAPASPVVSVESPLPRRLRLGFTARNDAKSSGARSIRACACAAVPRSLGGPAPRSAARFVVRPTCATTPPSSRLGPFPLAPAYGAAMSSSRGRRSTSIALDAASPTRGGQHPLSHQPPGSGF